MGAAGQPHIFSPVTNVESRPSPSPSPASRLLFAPPAQAYTRSCYPPCHACKKGPSAQTCMLTPLCSHAPLTLPSAAARRPSPLRAPPRLLIPQCAPTAHGPASNRSMPQKLSRSYHRQLLQESPTTPCVACLATPCGRGAVPLPLPLQAWLSRGQQTYVAAAVRLPSPCCPTYLTNIDPPIRSLTGTQEGSSLVAVIGSA
jgi:hypothetical protein